MNIMMSYKISLEFFFLIKEKYKFHKKLIQPSISIKMQILLNLPKKHHNRP